MSNPFKIAALLALVMMAGLAGCVSDAPVKRPPKVVQPAHPFSGANSPVMFEGTVLDTLPSPGAFSGLFTFFQGVHYRVDKVIAGDMAGGKVLVYHVLALPPQTEKETPELSHEIFKPGNKLRVKCERTRDGDYVDIYGNNTVEVIK